MHRMNQIPSTTNIRLPRWTIVRLIQIIGRSLWRLIHIRLRIIRIQILADQILHI